MITAQIAGLSIAPRGRRKTTPLRRKAPRGPREESTGDIRRLGSITKAGNVHARWMLIETVQCALNPPKVSAELSKRQEGQPTNRRDLSWETQVRLHKRGRHLLARGLLKPKIIVALAREMAGFVWAMLHLEPALAPWPPAGKVLTGP